MPSWGSWALCHRRLCLSRGVGLNNLPRCPSASTILCSSLMKTLQLKKKKKSLLIQRSAVLVKVQVGSYRWIWWDTFLERWLEQKPSSGRCHSSTASWRGAAAADCHSARCSAWRSRIQGARLPRERNGWVTIGPTRNVISQKGKVPFFWSDLRYRWHSPCHITINEDQKNLDNIWAASDSSVTCEKAAVKYGTATS